MRETLEVDGLILVSNRKGFVTRIAKNCFVFFLIKDQRILLFHLSQISFGDFYLITLIFGLNLGGSSFGFMSGANAEDDGSQYKADVTSYGNWMDLFDEKQFNCFMYFVINE